MVTGPSVNGNGRSVEKAYMTSTETRLGKLVMGLRVVGVYPGPPKTSSNLTTNHRDEIKKIWKSLVLKSRQAPRTTVGTSRIVNQPIFTHQVQVLEDSQFYSTMAQGSCSWSWETSFLEDGELDRGTAVNKHVYCMSRSVSEPRELGQVPNENS